MNKAFAGLMALVLLGGCATNGSQFSEKLYDGTTGLPTSDTTFKTSVRATLGSKLAEGAGSMDYTGENWQLKVGQSATGVQAGGDPVQLLRELTSIVRVLAPYLQQPATPTPETPKPVPTVNLNLPPIRSNLP